MLMKMKMTIWTVEYFVLVIGFSESEWTVHFLINLIVAIYILLDWFCNFCPRYDECLDSYRISLFGYNIY